MKLRKLFPQERGITLIGVVLLILAIGIIAFIAGGLGVKLQEIAKVEMPAKKMGRKMTLVLAPAVDKKE